MQLNKLDHVNVRTENLDAMVTWYTNVLGMRSGDRPNFAFPGCLDVCRRPGHRTSGRS